MMSSTPKQLSCKEPSGSIAALTRVGINDDLVRSHGELITDISLTQYKVGSRSPSLLQWKRKDLSEFEQLDSCDGQVMFS